MRDMIKLDLGCSYHKKEGFLGVDILSSKDVDVLADACFLPFKESSIDEIYSQYALEHIIDNISVIKEIFRVSKPGIKIRLILPHSSCPAFYDDITHSHKYSSRTWEHFDHDMHDKTGHPNYVPQVNFKLVDVKLHWWPDHIINQKKGVKKLVLFIINKVINFFANSNQFFCERIWCNYVGGFYEIDYTLIVRKNEDSKHV